MSPVADANVDAADFCDFALIAGSGVLEGLDAAGIDGRLADGPRAYGSPARAGEDGAFMA